MHVSSIKIPENILLQAHFYWASGLHLNPTVPTDCFNRNIIHLFNCCVIELLSELYRLLGCQALCQPVLKTAVRQAQWKVKKNDVA